MRKRKKCLTGLISIVLIVAFCISGCGGEEKSTKENVVDSETEKLDAKTLEDNKKIKKSTGFSTEYQVENAKDGYFIVSKLDGALFGVLDSYGNEVIPVEYDYISFPDSEKAQAFIVKMEGKMGILNYAGETILPIEYDNINNPEVKGTLYLAEKEGIQSIIKLDGTVYKELSGNYNDLIADKFLVIGGGPAYEEAYGLDEQVLFSGSISEANGKYVYGLDTVNGYLGVCDFGTSTMALMDSEGNTTMTFPFAQESDTYGMMKDIGFKNLVSIQYDSNGSLAVPHYKLIDIKNNTVVDKVYNKITGNSEAAFALNINSDAGTSSVDIYDSDGQIVKTVDFDSNSVGIEMDNPLIKVKYGDTYRFYNSKGDEVSDERYLEAEPVHDYWMVQNLDGEYGLMDPDGKMCINFGQIGKESYQGKEWEDTYVFEDIFCIVTESSDGSDVWLF